MISIRSKINDLKEVLKETGNEIPFPENGNWAVVVYETEIGRDYTVKVAVGEVAQLSRNYFEVRGKVFDDVYMQFTDALLQINPTDIERKRGERYVCYVYPEELNRAVAMADWDGKFKSIDDLIEVLKSLSS